MLHRLHHAIGPLDQEPGQAGLDQLGRGPAREGDHGGAAGHRLDHRQAEGLGPLEREDRRVGTRQELGLLLTLDVFLPLHTPPQPGFDVLAEIGHRLAAFLDLARQHERPARPPGRLDGHVLAFLGTHSGDLQEVVVLLARDRQGVHVHRVVHDPDPVELLDLAALGMADRDEVDVTAHLAQEGGGRFGDRPVDGRHRRNLRRHSRGHQDPSRLVVVVDQVDFDAGEVVIDACQVGGLAVAVVLPTKLPRPAGGGERDHLRVLQPRAVGGVEQDLVPHPAQLFGEEIDDQLDAAVTQRRHGVPGRGHQRNAEPLRLLHQDLAFKRSRTARSAPRSSPARSSCHVARSEPSGACSRHHTADWSLCASGVALGAGRSVPGVSMSTEVPLPLAKSTFEPQFASVALTGWLGGSWRRFFVASAFR